MFFKEDTTYNDIREKSLLQWLEEMERHEDVVVRGGVKLCREYRKVICMKMPLRNSRGVFVLYFDKR